MCKNDYIVFFRLLKAGLWAQAGTNFDVNLLCEQDDSSRVINKKDWDEVYWFAEEQSVMGVVLAGIEYSKAKPPQELLLQWIGEVQMLEQQNKAMNQFIAELIEKLRQADIYVLLVKGQGIAQCYTRPLWRACGDVDFFLSEENYKKAKELLLPMAGTIESEWLTSMHLGMNIDGWVVELHGSLRGSLSPKINSVLNKIKRETFRDGKVRSWVNNGTHIFMLDVNNDVIYVFTHFLNHFYKGGIGLRQICDWCRLLCTYRESLDLKLLESRLRKMGLMTEWKAFGAFTVEYLGMPSEAMPFYSADDKWKRKADKLCEFIMEVGNFGHNRDMSYYNKYPYLIRKVCSMGRRCGDVLRHMRIFPLDSLRFFPYIMYNGLRSAVRGE
jgi:hypothetical protein